MNEKGSGWRVFACIMLGIGGIMRFFDAIWAFAAHNDQTTSLEDALFGHSLTTYGWIYLLIAFLMIVASIGVVVGSQIGRWIGIVAGAVLAITAVWWMPYYPVWSLTYIGIGVLVIYGLVVYGKSDEALL
ncbi:hypothetical protein SAMN05892883_1646 [Jatrophihabitans sp. GAS493]|uniref:DUF7144 family membrane protein n=1 Tax=Jatrophihabitans sp. GAS493 TaxID=1907575 RepID=UPI000BB99F2C|nr:hypothetical protein [Jatrophihabitans sp. GAS493]SOD72230.1 hypothetical protein SAMN05892883_1646 [Jatrophihabitans sp. GAS493]